MLSIIIPCLNHYETTKKCLRYLFDYTSLYDAEIILVDDGSTDETKDFHVVSSPAKNFSIIRHDTNLGFPRSVNDGIRVAKGDIIAIFNNDMLVGPGWLQPIFRALNAYPDYGMLTGSLIEPDTCQDSEFLDYIKKLPSPHRASATTILPWQKGGPWVFRRSAIEKTGLFDEGFIHTQYEDSDYLLRMAINGIKHGRVTNSYIYHYSALTQNGELTKRVGTDYRAINRAFFAKKWGTVDIDYQKAYLTKGEIVSK